MSYKIPIILYRFMPLCRAMLIEDIFAFFYRPTQKQHVDIPLGHRLALLLMQVLHFIPFVSRRAKVTLCDCDTIGSLLLVTCSI